MITFDPYNRCSDTSHLKASGSDRCRYLQDSNLKGWFKIKVKKLTLGFALVISYCLFVLELLKIVSKYITFKMDDSIKRAGYAWKYSMR